MSRYVLGIDTSNYCTSLCLLSDAGEIMADKRKWLPVARGMKGVRQSDGVFHHVRQLADLWCSVTVPDSARLAAVCASSAPRPVEGSYMPVFTVGVNWGRSLAHAAGVPFYETTHQEGHIAAALGAADREVEEDVLTVLHLSGGYIGHAARAAFGVRLSNKKSGRFYRFVCRSTRGPDWRGVRFVFPSWARTRAAGARVAATPISSCISTGDTLFVFGSGNCAEAPFGDGAASRCRHRPRRGKRHCQNGGKKSSQRF